MARYFIAGFVSGMVTTVAILSWIVGGAILSAYRCVESGTKTVHDDGSMTYRHKTILFRKPISVNVNSEGVVDLWRCEL